MTTFSDMLEEMVVRILSRLLPKTLVRFRCVSRLWYTIINDPSFVARHLSNSMHNKFASDTCILVKHNILKDRSITDEEEIAALKIFYDNKDILLSLLRICRIDDGDGGNLTFVVENLDILFPSSINPSSLDIVGYCDGIICLNSSNNLVSILCNPAIREFKVLPDSCVFFDLPPAAEDEDEDTKPWSNTAAMGFGFDAKAKEYKIVRVVETTSGTYTRHPTRAEVYTMGTNSWRELENVDTGCDVFWAPSFFMHFKGICYWWAFSPTEKEVILTFDTSDELFHQIPMPDCLDFHKELERRYRSLAMLKESIVLLTYEADDAVPKSFDIWMLDESTCVRGASWTKYLAFGPVEGINIPLVFWNSEELLMVTNDSRVVSYNLGTQKLHHFPIQGVEEACYLQAVNYVNSIISVK